MLLLWEPRVDLSRNGQWKCIAEATRPLAAAGFPSPVMWAHTPPCVPAKPLQAKAGDTLRLTKNGRGEFVS